MPIYEKSTRVLMQEFVKDQKIKKGDVISRNQVVNWFTTNYPKIKYATISAHLIRMSINAPSRVHYSVNQHGDDDLFYQIDGGSFRLYDRENDPTPIYKKSPIIPGSEDEFDEEESLSKEIYNATGFAYERDLRDFLAKNLPLIEPRLMLYEDEGITGVEFPVGGRFIDILALDAKNDYVVIELKVSRGYDRVIGQLLRYMAWIEKNQAEPGQKVRGIIIAREISSDLHLAVSKIPDVQLFEYDLSVTLRNVGR